MKKYLMIGIIIVVVLTLFISVILLLPKKENKIKNMYYLYYTYSTGYHMYGYVTYKIECNDECILSIKPEGVDDDETENYEIKKEVLKEIENKLNEYHVEKWNGYDKTDKYVLDGNSFSMIIKSDNGEINAHGYMRWPNNYNKVKDYLISLFNQYK